MCIVVEADTAMNAQPAASPGRWWQGKRHPNMTKLFLIPIFLVVSLTTFGQYTICDCCTYSSLQYEENFENIFSPETIKKNNITQLIIYTTSRQSSKNPKDTTYKIIDKEYTEMILKFDSNGFVETQILFNRLGKYHSSYEFTRDNGNRILTKTFHYLDSLGGKVKDMGVEKSVYSYSSGHLKQVKKLGENGQIEPDNKSTYTSYEYDAKGRIVVEVRQTYYDPSTPIYYYQTKIRYNDATNSSIAITNDKKRLFSTVINNYRPDMKLLSQKSYYGLNKKLSYEKVLAYTATGQLQYFQTKSSGGGSECPDGGNLDDNYFYSPINLISNIRHHYKNTICEMRFVYK
jgi:hypothetical protein